MEKHKEFATVKATYRPETQEVALETKYRFNNQTSKLMFEVNKMQDRAIIEAIPNDALTQLYLSIQTEIHKRGLKL